MKKKKPLDPGAHLRIKKGDTVMKIAGVGKGKTGKVLKVFPVTRKVIVEGMNMVKRHTKAGRQQGQQGGIIEKESPIPVSNVMLVVNGKATRVGYSRLADGTKVRIARKTGDSIA